MAAVSLENWTERIRDPKIECMSRDEMAALQSKRLVDVVNRVYNNVEFYRKKCRILEWNREILKGSKISINFRLRQKKI